MSIGLSIAVAPAILLGIGILSGSADTIEVTEHVLFRAALPLGAVLVLVGLLVAAARRIPRPEPKPRPMPAPKVMVSTPQPQVAPNAQPKVEPAAPVAAAGPVDDIRPLTWQFQALGVVWRHMGLLAVLGAVVAAVDMGFEKLWSLLPSIGDPFRALQWLASSAIGAYAYRMLLLQEEPSRDTGSWPTPQRAVLQAMLIQLLALLIIATFLVLGYGLLSLLSPAVLNVAEVGKDTVSRLITGLLGLGAVWIALPVLVALPLALLLETAVVLAVGEVVTTTDFGHLRFLAALRRMWRRKFSFILPSYGMAVLALLVGVALMLTPVARTLGPFFEPLLSIVGFAWWVGYVAVVHRALSPERVP